MGYLCILWHFHQPFYVDIEENINNTSIIFFRTLQNYYPMAILSEEFENIKLNFNITGSLLKQIKFISEGIINDIFFNFFNYELSPEQLIYYYNEFPSIYLNNKILTILREKIESGSYNEKDIFDFKFLLHLTCFNKLLIDKEIASLIQKGRDFNEDDLKTLISKEKEIFKNFIPKYKNLQESNKIEISTSPFYHPILPLVYDTEIMKRTKTNLKYPEIRFNYPEDAKQQLNNAILFYNYIFGKNPEGIWPSEGALSDEILDLFIEKKIKWTATDETILFETLNNWEKKNIYKCYKYKGNITIFFRDHFISDLIGFSYHNLDEEKAAIDLINNIEKIIKENPDGIITIILDGENPWDYYQENGIKFLRTFYKLLEKNEKIKTLTFKEAVENIEIKKNINHIFPGSWMGPNFDNWIGKSETNKAWKILKEAREKFEQIKLKDELTKELILNVEGSDWFWWYSIDADKNIKNKFDKCFKDNIRKIYKRLNIPIPDNLEEEIIYEEKIPYIKPIIDGKITDFYEWINGIEIKLENLWGSFKPFNLPIKKFLYGYDEENLYLRFDFEEKVELIKVNIDEEIYEIKGTSFFDENIEWKLDDILEVRLKIKNRKQEFKIKFQVIVNNYNFTFPPYGKITIIYREPEWIV
ncbi:MAG: glycoside hydrolase family 57 protein [Candidatus Omnitrophica bacterium]|nr:glycoside hydrolase family 57 protein [Candidatus Omnitrophota bacterium]